MLNAVGSSNAGKRHVQAQSRSCHLEQEVRESVTAVTLRLGPEGGEEQAPGTPGEDPQLKKSRVRALSVGGGPGRAAGHRVAGRGRGAEAVGS